MTTPSVVRKRYPALSRGAAWARGIEFIILFVAAPGLIAAFTRGMVFPAIWAIGLITLAWLMMDRSFDKRELFAFGAVKGALPWMLGRFILCAAGLTLILWALEPERLLQLPRRDLRLWAMVMTLYPLLSVLPQEVAFRVFMFHRYGPLFRDPSLLIAATALAFGWAHIIMHNWWAVGFSVLGGAIFGYTYLRTRSLPAVCVEHAIYGDFLFTIGWGWYFYGGAGR